MGKKDAVRPRIVCCAIPILRSSGKVLLITSRKRSDHWILPKGGYETADVSLEAAACREALEEAGVRGPITCFVTTIKGVTATYHVYELDVTALESTWLEQSERAREWVDYAEAVRRLAWKPELVQALTLSSLAPRR
ncbi:SubName: Full=Uncharacterized protein {ECO:0000313/EMBL:CCA68870.1} [Serendipita indica DSM 11827]|uniref:Nudix hydrolase domain-containing protein n=1 Tax=Serendipita indica (strain DSM 11827) TaxID=1109443 RepID=G4TC27_SERID|nr:SubName: Full=Uncharacterized protein {ECO:0000313/EMBL:CCA68870.1} [Serendipita indica DSM 11827]CCA68870.1 hypothetical protein PIIN_02730 [Serendipita indica DSM 11827]